MQFKTIVFLFTLVFVLSCNKKQDKPLPIYNPANFNPKLVDKSLQNKSEYHTVSDFSLINQNGETITQEDYKNKIYIADFFFTRCETICPIMTDNMVEIQEEFLNDIDIMFLSLSVTPEIDSVQILREYANKKGNY